jgi:prepilin-type N-terminal cleavage/methylation domain-containing protein
MTDMYRSRHGFTLLEMSIVLALIGVIVGGGLVVVTSSLQASQYNSTVARMDTIEKALLNFAVANNRIPCPADLTLTASGSANYGLEAGAGSGSAIAPATGVCSGTNMLPKANFIASSGTAEGGVPTRALQLPDDYIYDGWGRKFRYAVDPTYTKTVALPASAVSSCSVASSSAITVNDATGAARTTAGMYALISHGANGHGAYTSNGVTYNAGSTSANELTNCHCTSAGVYNSPYTPTYIEKAPAYDAGQTGNQLYYFDDIVTFKESWQMQTPAFSLSAMPQCVYVADANNNRIQVFNTSGGFVMGIGAGYNGISGSIGSSGSGNGQLNGPFGIALDASGNIWEVDDSFNNNGISRVQEFNRSGSYLSQFGSGYGCCGGPFDYPTGIAFDASGNIWVVNNNPGWSAPPPYAVLKFNSSGTLLTSFGSGAGSNPVPLGQSTFIAIDASGNLWISTPSGPILQEFSSSGTYLTSVGTSYPYRAQYATAFDSSGNLWTLGDPGGNFEVQEFNASGTLLTNFGSTGSANGQFNFTYEPDNGGIAIDANGNLWVVDSGNNRVQEFSTSGSFIRGIGAGYNGVSGSIGSSGSASGQFNQPEGIAIGNR